MKDSDEIFNHRMGSWGDSQKNPSTLMDRREFTGIDHTLQMAHSGDCIDSPDCEKSHRIRVKNKPQKINHDEGDVCLDNKVMVMVI